MTIIDYHTHFYPKSITQNIETWAKENGESYWIKLVGKREDGKASLQSFPTISQFLNAMDEAEVEKACIQGWYWQNSKTAEKINAEIAKEIEKYPDRLFGYATVNPCDNDALENLRRAQDMGYVGVGELHDKVQKFDFFDEKFDVFCKKCAEIHFPICVHLSDPRGKNYPNKMPTANEKAYATARRNPKTTFIFAHFGGGDVFLPNFVAPENVYYDCAANTFLYGKEGFEKAPKEVLEKLIFGSDYPLRLYPKKYKFAEMREFVQSIKCLNEKCFNISL